MSDEENQDIPMAECGACGSIVPLDSESCPNCEVRFEGVSDEQLGECGACGAIIPVDSESCTECGASFVAEESMSAGEEVPDEKEPVEDHSDEEGDEEDESSGDEDAEEDDSDDEDDNDSDDDEEEEVDSDDDEEEEVDSDDDGEEVDSDEDEEEEDDSDDDEEEEDDADSSETDETTPEDVFKALGQAIAAEGLTIRDVFESMDADLDGRINGPELQNGIEDILGDRLAPTDVLAILGLLDSDSDGNIDPMELVEAIESLELDIDSDKVSDSDDEDDGIEDSAIVMAFENLALAIAESGMTAGEAFGEMDTSADNLIDAPELQKGIEKIAGEKLPPKHVTAILNYLDKDGNKRIDPKELIDALEDLRIGIKPGKVPKVKTFPSPAQKFLMSKKANDIFYPIAYFLMVTFIGLWVVNGMGLLVDGTGGTVVYDGGVDQWGGEITEANWNLCQSDALEEMIDPCQGTVAVGETYPCDPALDPNKCANSLTPFSGENDASSMPAGFYGDGIFMIILGVIGLAVTAYLHLIYAPALRDTSKKGSKKSDEEDDDEDDDSDEDEEDDDEDDDSDEEEEDDDDDDEDDIDVGDWIGLDIDGEEFFGEIIEFDDDEGTVTIETEDGEEVTGDQDDMFLEDEDDE